MKAWTIKQPGGRDQLIIKDQPLPNPTKDEVLVKVDSTAINRTDIMTREDSSLKAPYPILGVEISGIVEKEAPNYPELKRGTRVAGLVNRGGYAEYAVMPANRAIVVPDSMSLIDAAAIPEVFLTAYQTMFWLGELKPQETILIHAAGSGVGTAAIQLASRKITDANIIATAGSKHKLEMAKALGAQHTINYKKEDFAKKVLDYTNGHGADVILDFVGASYWEQNLKSAAIDGRWILIGTLGGAEVEKISISDLMKKRLSLKGTLLTPRSDDYKAKLTQEFSKRIIPFFEEDIIQPIIHSVLSFEDLPEAHRQMEASENTGKIIIQIADD
ncbi:MAG TPA: NAD(P)H-quinone oxidoreductase [Candidatus Atopostipes pullistercoris]|uniref:NAD(P)H-quinone oxidoreductase n=1 Tax=Candidatus Atopostipes pullistercoris TaxID=2838467 RepID=A0A9D2G2F1_9LACT|nr:NAD(P)H-quinone oxidoreductase [Candidatus Atopostipes pullistercoris]